MPYGLHFVSIDPMRRRIAQSADSVSPGFTGIIATVDIFNKRCDVWVQGTTNVLRGVRFGIGTQQVPSYIKVGSAVYLRHPRGNKFQLEISGPAFAVPSISAGGDDGPIPQTPTAADFVLDIAPGAYASRQDEMTAVTTKRFPIFRGLNPQALLNGSLLGASSFPQPKVGENHDLKVSGFTAGGMKVGEGGRLGLTYLVVPIGAAGTNYEWNTIEMGKSDHKIYIQTGTASLGAPEVPATPSTRILLGTVLTRPSQTKIWQEDVNAVLTTGLERISATPSQRRIAYSEAGTYTPLSFTILVRDSGGTAVASRLVSATLGVVPGTSLVTDRLGAMTPSSPITNASGQSVFEYRRDSNTNRSVFITFATQPPNISESVRVTVRVYNGNDLGVPYS